MRLLLEKSAKFEPKNVVESLGRRPLSRRDARLVGVAGSTTCRRGRPPRGEPLVGRSCPGGAILVAVLRAVLPNQTVLLKSGVSLTLMANYAGTPNFSALEGLELVAVLRAVLPNQTVLLKSSNQGKPHRPLELLAWSQRLPEEGVWR